MITKTQIQFIRSLDQKKNRDESSCFIAEGDKLVREALELPIGGRFQVKTVCGVGSWLDSCPGLLKKAEAEVIHVTPTELERISHLKSPNQVLAVVYHHADPLPELEFNQDLFIGLSKVQDPGNVGTIIRLADWYGLGGVVASADSADFFSPKVVQASMGSIFRVKLLSADLHSLIRSLPSGYPVYATHLKGKNLYTAAISSKGIILMGNESRGLGDEIMALTTESLLIPDFATGKSRPESLNVSIAAAIICSEFRRRGSY